jgi:hypothetical protein
MVTPTFSNWFLWRFPEAESLHCEPLRMKEHSSRNQAGIFGTGPPGQPEASLDCVAQDVVDPVP